MKRLFAMTLGLLIAATGAVVQADVTVTNSDGVTDWDTEAGTAPGLDQTVSVLVDETIIDIRYDFTGATHTWMGDLSIELIAPDTTSMFIVGQLTGGGTFGDSSDWGGSYSFEDGSASLWTEAAARGDAEPITPGTYAASEDDGFGAEQINSFAGTFGGMSTQGTWTIRFFDSFSAGDTGGLTSWTLNFNTIPEPTTAGLLGLIGLIGFGVRRRRV